MGHVDLPSRYLDFFSSLSVWFFSVLPWVGRSRIFSLLCLLPLSLSQFLFCIRTMPSSESQNTHTLPTPIRSVLGLPTTLTRPIGLQWEIGTGQSETGGGAGDR